MLNKNYYIIFLVDHFIPFRVKGRGHIRAKAASTTELPVHQRSLYDHFVGSVPCSRVLWHCSEGVLVVGEGGALGL